MSLDVTLTTEPLLIPSEPAILIRENGRVFEISRYEWDARFPGVEPVCVAIPEDGTKERFSANITHNLGRMAEAAGIYKALWRPEEIQITHAKQLVPILREGLARLVESPNKWNAFNPENGWGNRESLVSFVREYLNACETYPEAVIHISR